MHRVYFSFDYDDFSAADIINSTFLRKRVANTFFIEKPVWNGALRKGKVYVKRLIEKCVLGSDVTVFLVGDNTQGQEWCHYALEVSRSNHKKIFGIYLPNQMSAGLTTFLSRKRVKIYQWDSKITSRWIDAATKAVVRY